MALGYEERRLVLSFAELSEGRIVVVVCPKCNGEHRMQLIHFHHEHLVTGMDGSQAFEDVWEALPYPRCFTPPFGIAVDDVDRRRLWLVVDGLDNQDQYVGEIRAIEHLAWRCKQEMERRGMWERSR